METNLEIIAVWSDSVPGAMGAQAENNMGTPKGIKDSIGTEHISPSVTSFFFLFPYSPDMSNLPPKNAF